MRAAQAVPNLAQPPGEIAQLIREGIERLEACGMASARTEVEWLLSRLVGCAPLELYLDRAPLEPGVSARFRAQLQARALGQPLQYVMGETEFFGARFSVAPGVFIPRPETEVIVEAALTALREHGQGLGRPLRLLEFGVGSGCIAVTCARELPTCLLVGIEVSWPALRLARHNLLQHGLGGRVWLVQGWWDQPIAGGFDGIISNPPYVPSRQVDRLPPDVRQEPRESLDGGADGLRDLRYLLDRAPVLLNRRGIAVFECGEAQAAELVRLGRAASWVQEVCLIRDLTGRPRGALIRAR